MNRRAWSGLIVGIAICMVPLIAATNALRTDEAWPTLLASEPVGPDPDILLLQRRANRALERLVASADAARSAQ